MRHIINKTLFALFAIFAFGSVAVAVEYEYTCYECAKGYYCSHETYSCESCNSSTFKTYYKGFYCPEQKARGYPRRSIRPEQLSACTDLTIPTKKFDGCEEGDKSLTLKPGEFFDGSKKQNCNEQLSDKMGGSKGNEYLPQFYYFALTDKTTKYPKIPPYVGLNTLYCPGNKTIKYSSDSSRNYIKGLYLCDSGYSSWPETNRTECEPDPTKKDDDGDYIVSCKAGEYIPANHRSCRSCENLTSAEKTGCEQGFTIKFKILPKNHNIYHAGAIRDGANMKDSVCPSGSLYTDATRTKCTPCSVGLDNNKYVCDISKMQNKYNYNVKDFCQGGYKAGTEFVQCDTTNCFLPGGLTQCVKCNADNLKKTNLNPERYICSVPNGKDGWEHAPQHQGIKECGENEKPNATNTKCESIPSAQTTPACNYGQAAFATDNVCFDCKSKPLVAEYARTNRVICHGGAANGRDWKSFLSPCPKGMWPNEDFTACVCWRGKQSSPKLGDKCTDIVLTRDDLKYGYFGANASQNKQCWTKRNKADYKKCMGF